MFQLSGLLYSEFQAFARGPCCDFGVVCSKAILRAVAVLGICFVIGLDGIDSLDR